MPRAGQEGHAQLARHSVLGLQPPAHPLRDVSGEQQGGRGEDAAVPLEGGAPFRGQPHRHDRPGERQARSEETVLLSHSQ